MNESLKVKGHLTVRLFNKNGRLKAIKCIDNLVVSSGLNFIANRMANESDSVMSHMAIGEGSVAASASNTALGSEAARVSLTSAAVTGSAIKYIGTFNAGVGTGSISEAGVFNASSNGTMLCRTVFSTLEKQDDDSLQIEWTVTVSA
jgi:hypothetical protein